MIKVEEDSVDISKQLQRWEIIKEIKKVRKKERKHALDQEKDQEKRKFLN